MRVLLDLQACQSVSRERGIGGISLELAKAIARNAGTHEVWLLLNDLFPDTVIPLRQEFAGLIPVERIALFSAPGPVAAMNPVNSARARVAELIREYAISEIRPDVVHLGHLFEGFFDDAVTSIGSLETSVPTAVTLYDVDLPKDADPSFDIARYGEYHERKFSFLSAADLMLAASAAVKHETESRLNRGEIRLLDDLGAHAEVGPSFEVSSSDLVGSRPPPGGREPGVASTASWDRAAREALSAFQEISRNRGNQAVTATESSCYCRLIARIAVEGETLSHADLTATAEAVAKVTRSEAPKQLLLDVSRLIEGDYGTGIHRVTRALLVQLFESPPPGYHVRPIRLDLGRQGYRYAREFEGRFRDLAHDLGADEIVEMRAGDVFLGLDLVYDRVPQLREWFLTFRRWGGLVVFLVYDILAVRHPQWWWPGAGKDFERWLRSIAEVSTKLVAISRAVADDLQDWLWSSGAAHDPGLSIEYFHLGADLKNSAPTKGLPADHQSVLCELAGRPTFLMVGTIEPRKGHEQALSAFERLWMAGVKANLVIVGKHGWSMDGFMDRLRRHPELGRHLFWLDYVTDEYLEKLYASASCLIVASEGEGFGLPLIEAAQHKLPIIARDIPVFREVAEENAYFFRGASGEALAGAVRGWLTLSENGAVPSSEAIRWLTWAESATQLMDVVLGSDLQIRSNADLEAP